MLAASFCFHFWCTDRASGPRGRVHVVLVVLVTLLSLCLASTFPLTDYWRPDFWSTSSFRLAFDHYLATIASSWPPGHPPKTMSSTSPISPPKRDLEPASSNNQASSSSAPAPKRTRSRNGCLVCRARRIKCDLGELATRRSPADIIRTTGMPPLHQLLGAMRLPREEGVRPKGRGCRAR